MRRYLLAWGDPGRDGLHHLEDVGRIYRMVLPGLPMRPDRMKDVWALAVLLVSIPELHEQFPVRGQK